MKILVIDNYDSFTFNLVHLVQETGHEATVWRNDKFDLAEVEAFDKVILSPGPGLPSEAGLMPALIDRFKETHSILGVCLGMQAIAENFGAELYNLDQPVHGRSVSMKITDVSDPLFEKCPPVFKVGRYHSWAVKNQDLPEQIKVTAVDEQEVIMAIRHERLRVRGVQFHPESVLTQHGKRMLMNWLNPAI